ncbi:hypothetical protein [Gordonia sp. N1V]|uniref:hypothetical protein n=1 Tax=Gordonia sp. N1V TaxID=3034163 RepID=UPI0023E2DD51|nr:hypothetical protein [Gordonia sp. N1V]MDF3280463.1 hypothetical protein [Gordonia sp. N1V]
MPQRIAICKHCNKAIKWAVMWNHFSDETFEGWRHFTDDDWLHCTGGAEPKPGVLDGHYVDGAWVRGEA